MCLCYHSGQDQEETATPKWPGENQKRTNAVKWDSQAGHSQRKHVFYLSQKQNVQNKAPSKALDQKRDVSHGFVILVESHQAILHTERDKKWV